MLLWGIEAEDEEESDEEIMDEDIEGYQICPIAKAYSLLERHFKYHPCNSEPNDGWYKGGIMEKLIKKIAHSNANGVYETALAYNTTQALVGKPLHFVYDIVGVETKWTDLKYVLNAVRPPMKDGPDFEKVYGITRKLTLDNKSKRSPVVSNIFENVY